MTASRRPDFGLDAPAVVRNLLIVGVAGLVLALGIAVGIIPREVALGGSNGSGGVHLGLLGMGLGPGIGCTATGLAMIWNSRIGKVHHRDALLRRLPWRGDERVLDVGCGRGLMLVGAAAKLTTGRATGIDIWRDEDLAHNSREATLENARVTGVADRVVVETADMRALPYADGSFDVALSCAAIHNVPTRAERATAIAEIARVLAPGGHALIDDIRHFGDYRDAFAQHGCTLRERLDNKLVSALWTIVSFGSLRPGAMLVQKVR